MALNPTQLGLAMAMASNPLGPSAAEITQWTAVASAIISHFISNAVINTTDTVTIPPTGVATILAPTPAGPAPCTGTASGTGTGVGKIS